MPRTKKKVEAEKAAPQPEIKATIRDFDIIRSPIHTEKTQSLQTNHNTMVLEVSVDASKDEIKRAVERIFGVKVDKVNTINVRKKPTRRGRYNGFTNRYKKAIVILNKASDLAEIAKAAHEQ